MAGCCNAKSGLIAGAVLGALVAILGGILIPVGDSIIRDTVRKEAVIENGTTAYENWVSTGGAVYRQFWIFNVTNPLDVIQSGAEPVVTEQGPYTYRTRYLPKVNITVHNNNTIAFLLPAGAIFEPSMSVGQEEDVFTVLNLFVAGVYSMPKEVQVILNSFINKQNATIFQTRSVKEILWGYHETIISPNMSSTFGLFYPYNGTYDGYYNVFTGKDDISKVGVIDSWMGEQQVSFWNDKYCNMINGTDASSFQPFLDKKPLYFFTSDICRSVSAEFSGVVNLKGIEMYRYSLSPMTLAAPSVNPDNMCYCRDPIVTKNCTLAGVLDISSCKGGIPVYISLPHFLHGSTELRDLVLGLNPSEDTHSTYLDVEPTTGFTMRFAKRLQINMMYGPSNILSALKNVKNHTIFPVAWLNETAALDDETADMFKAELTSRVQMLEDIQVALLSVGSVVFLACAIGACVVHSKQNKGQFV